MHPAIGWGVPRVHRDTQGWRLSLKIILPCVEMCRTAVAHRLLMEIFSVIMMWVHSILNKPQQLSCKATLVFLPAW